MYLHKCVHISKLLKLLFDFVFNLVIIINLINTSDDYMKPTTVTFCVLIQKRHTYHFVLSCNFDFYPYFEVEEE